jgi:hypothetical protein
MSNCLGKEHVEPTTTSSKTAVKTNEGVNQTVSIVSGQIRTPPIHGGRGMNFLADGEGACLFGPTRPRTVTGTPRPS